MHALSHFHLLDAFFSAQIGILAAFEISGSVGFYIQFFRNIAVIDLHVAALGNCPNPLVAVSSHDVEDFHFAAHDVGVRLTVPSERRPAAEDIKAIDHTIAAEPMQVFIEHGLAKLEKLFLVLGNVTGTVEKLVDDHFGDGPIAVLEQVDTVHRERLLGRAIKLLSRAKQVNKRYVLLRADLFKRRGKRSQLLVVSRSIRQVRTMQILVGDRRKDDQPRRRFAVVLLLAHVVDHTGQFRAVGSAQRFVVAEETEDHVSLAFGEPLVGIAEIRRALSRADLVAGKAQIAKGQIMIGMQSVDIRLQPGMMLHAVRHRIADVANVVTFPQFESIRRPQSGVLRESCQCHGQGEHRNRAAVNLSHHRCFSARL